MAALTTGAIVALGIAGAGTAYSVHQGRQAEKAQKRATQVQRRQRQAEEARARRGQIAEARKKRAQVVNAATAGGVQNSSGMAGGLGSLQSQLGSNLGFMSRGSARTNMFEKFAADANQHQSNANTGSAIANLAFTAAPMFGSTGGAPATPNPRQARLGSPMFDTPGPNPRG